MAVIVGFAGPDVRSDVRVTVSDATSTTVEVQSTVKAIYGEAIEQQSKEILETFGSPKVGLLLEDTGALPFILQARIEAALAKHLGVPLPECGRRKANPDRIHLRRSRLYIPGNQPKFMPNAGIYSADALIFDLEDSVPSAEKEFARALVRQAVATLALGGAECMVRVNSGETGVEDIRAIAPAGPDVFVLPKVESAEDVERVDSLLRELGSNALILAILESALGVQHAYDIARASERVVALTLGVEDYLTDIGATDKAATQWANGAILNACRAAKIMPLASVTSAVTDEKAVESFATEMASLGFEGVGCLHPSQIEPAHRGFAPAIEALEEAGEIVAEFEKALLEGKGAISVRGNMVDEPIYRRAKRTLALGGPT